MNIQYLIHVSGFGGEKHNLSPLNLDSKYKASYRCMMFQSPKIHNSRTLRDMHNVASGIGLAEEATFVCCSHPLFAELLNQFDDGSTIEEVVILKLGHTATGTNSKLGIIETHKFKHVTLLALNFWSSESYISVNHNKINSIVSSRINFNEYHFNMSAADAENNIITGKTAISNAESRSIKQ